MMTTKTTTKTQRHRKDVLAPDPEMWAAFEDGAMLRRALEDFYTRVYADERLSPFFVHATKERAIEKQYSFLRSIFTGERCYFGFRPRNAHHWMVISDELFDYREELMADCLRRHGLPEHLVARFREVDEVFRKQIVKDDPFPCKMGGAVLPLDGYDELEMPVATICDDCGGEITEGTIVRTHKRTGQTYCPDCFPEDSAA